MDQAIGWIFRTKKKEVSRGVLFALSMKLQKETSDHSDSKMSAWQRKKSQKNHMRQTAMTPAGFEPPVQASERAHTLALDRPPAGIGSHNSIV